MKRLKQIRACTISQELELNVVTPGGRIEKMNNCQQDCHPTHNPIPLFTALCQALSSEIAAHKPQLEETVAAGRELEGYTDAEKATLPDIGYTALEERYNAAKVDRKKILVCILLLLCHFTCVHDILWQLLVFSSYHDAAMFCVNFTFEDLITRRITIVTQTLYVLVLLSLATHFVK